MERLSVEYSLSSALFILAKGSFTLDQDLLDRVEARMRELSAAAVPIEKRSISTDDAIDLFQKARLVHKAQLFTFRINSHVNVYSLDGFVDYFYGYMAPDTGYIRCFGLELFENGFVLSAYQKDPQRLGEFRPSPKGVPGAVPVHPPGRGAGRVQRGGAEHHHLPGRRHTAGAQAMRP